MNSKFGRLVLCFGFLPLATAHIECANASSIAPHSNKIQIKIGVTDPTLSSLYHSVVPRPQSRVDLQALITLSSQRIQALHSEVQSKIDAKLPVEVYPLRDDLEVAAHLLDNDARLYLLVRSVFDRLESNNDPYLFGPQAPKRVLTVGHWLIQKNSIMQTLQSGTLQSTEEGTALKAFQQEYFALGLNIRHTYSRAMLAHNPWHRFMGIVFHELGHFFQHVGDKEYRKVSLLKLAGNKSAEARLARNSVAVENRSDCIAGYISTHYLPAELNFKEAKKLKNFFFSIGDTRPDARENGTHLERAAAFDKGWNGGNFQAARDFTVSKMKSICFDAYPLQH